MLVYPGWYRDAGIPRVVYSLVHPPWYSLVHPPWYSLVHLPWYTLPGTPPGIPSLVHLLVYTAPPGYTPLTLGIHRSPWVYTAHPVHNGVIPVHNGVIPVHNGVIPGLYPGYTLG